MEAGDVVKLKSGGPLMTINEEPCSSSKYFSCVWFDENFGLCEGNFNVYALKKARIDEE